MPAQREYKTESIVLGFARCGVSMATIARALVVTEAQVENVCRRAFANGEIAALPPRDRADARGAMAAEVANLRAKVDEQAELIRELQSGDAQTVDMLHGWRGLTRSQARILERLLTKGLVSKESMYFHLYSSRMDGDSPEPKIIDVWICKLRKKLPAGIEIETKYGYGWEMPAKSRRKLREEFGFSLVASPSIVPDAEPVAA